MALATIFTLAAALGTVNSVDQPARQTFVPELVGRDLVQNARPQIEPRWSPPSRKWRPPAD